MNKIDINVSAVYKTVDADGLKALVPEAIKALDTVDTATGAGNDFKSARRNPRVSY